MAMNQLLPNRLIDPGHMMVLDGVYTLKNNRPCFHRVNAPDRSHLEKLLNRIIARVTRRLVKDGLLIPDSEQPWLDLEETDVLDTLNAASTRYRVSIGSDAGRRTLTLKNPALIRTDTQPKPFTVDRDGFSLNAAVSCQPHQRKQLERLQPNYAITRKRTVAFNGNDNACRTSVARRDRGCAASLRLPRGLC